MTITVSKELWEVLIPTITNEGKPIRTRFHRVWDTKVRELTNGLTVLNVAKGQWVSPEGDIFEERMIPVRIACTEDQLNEILEFTIKYYDQKAIFAYKISDTVKIYTLPVSSNG